LPLQAAALCTPESRLQCPAGARVLANALGLALANICDDIGNCLNESLSGGLLTGAPTTTTGRESGRQWECSHSLEHRSYSTAVTYFRFRGPGRTYYKTAAQRSLDAAGAQSTINRNPSGLEFLQEGNGLLLINEVGFQHADGGPWRCADARGSSGLPDGAKLLDQLRQDRRSEWRGPPEVAASRARTRSSSSGPMALWSPAPIPGKRGST